MIDRIIPKINGVPVKWNQTQHEFITTRCEKSWMAGAFGAGKTYALLWGGEILADEMPGGAGMVGTYRSPQFYRAIYPKLKEIWKDVIVGEQKRPVHQIFTRTKDTKPFCWTLQSFGEPDKLGGDDLNIVLGDEMNVCSVDSHKALAARMRHPASPKHYIKYASNNRGKDWLYKMFVQDNLKNDRPDYWWKRTSTFENLHNLPGNYLENFKNFGERWWKRNIYGEFIEFTGSVYDMLDEKVHLIPRLKPEKYWNINYTLDHGFNHPTFCILWCTDEFDNTVAFDEYVMKGMDPVDNAKNIVEFLKPYIGYGRFPLDGYADPSMWDKHGGHDPMSDYEDIFLKAGLNPPLPAYTREGPYHKIKIQGAYQIMGRLKPKAGHQHLLTGTDPAPSLYFTEDCKETWESLAAVVWDEEDASDTEKLKKEDGDDGADCVWYHCWNEPQIAIKPDGSTRVFPRPSLAKQNKHDRFCPRPEYDYPGVRPDDLVGVGSEVHSRHVPYGGY